LEWIESFISIWWTKPILIPYTLWGFFWQILLSWVHRVVKKSRKLYFTTFLKKETY
jgi:hypothetical protein